MNVSYMHYIVDCGRLFLTVSTTCCPSAREQELRLVLVGMRGAGKSSTGNSILGQQGFITTTVRRVSPRCYKDSAVVDGQLVSVIDTPDRFLENPHSYLIGQCVTLAAPGPHVFLVVTRLDRPTEEEDQLMQSMKKIFGPDVDRRCLVVFTGGDQLEDTMEELLDRSPVHGDLVARCHGQYHVFNNKLEDQAQVTELLHKIRNMVQENGGQHFTNQMFQEATRKIEEQKKKEERRCPEEEEEC